MVDERPVYGVAVDLELHRNLRAGPRLDREPPGQEAAMLGGRDRLTECRRPSRSCVAAGPRWWRFDSLIVVWNLRDASPDMIVEGG